MSSKDRFTVAGKDLVEKKKQVVNRGDVRRVCLIQEEKNLLEIPLMTGDPLAPATALAVPVLAAITAFATLIKECTIEVELADTVESKA
jgi:hypothetical protein